MNMVEIVVKDKKLHVGLDKFVLGLPYPSLAKTDIDNPPSQDELVDVDGKRKEFVATMKHLINMIKVTGNYHCAKTLNKDLKCQVPPVYKHA